MPKVPDLPLLLAPDGEENVIVEVGGIVQRARLGGLVGAQIDGVVNGLTDIIGFIGDTLDATDTMARASRLTAGEQTLIYARGQMFGGATPIIGPAGDINYVGFTSPAGLPTQLSFVTPRIAFTDADRARLTGRTIRLIAKATVTSGFLTDRALSAPPVTVDLIGGGQRIAAGELDRSEQIGDTLYREALYVVQGDEFFVGLPLQLANDSGTANDHSLQVTGTTYTVEALPAGLASSPADEQFAAKLDTYMAVNGIGDLPDQIGQKRIGFVNSLAELTPLVAPAGDAVARVGADGRNWGWTVPVGGEGGTTLMQVALDLRGLGAMLAGRTVRVSFEMATSDDYAEFQPNGATFAVARPSDPNKFLGTPIPKPPTQDVSDPNKRYYQFDGLMDGTETVLKPFFRRGPQPPAVTEQHMLVTDVTLEIVASPSKSLSLLEENLRLGEALRAAAMKDTVNGQISAAILGTGKEVITVGPSGAHFTTLSAAIDAVTGSSVAKQFEILWRAGATLGEPRKVVPPYTWIKAADRNEDAIMSYELPIDAPASTIRNTELLLLYNHMSIIEGGTWRIKNGKYVFHPESGGVHPNTEQRLIGLVAEHLGNLTAINNNLNIGSQFAIACGLSDGQLLKVIDTDASGPGGGFSTHGPNNNQPWWRPWICDLDSSRFRATWAGQFDVRIVALAVGAGRVPLRNCTLETMQLTDDQWIGGPPAPDVNTAQIDIIAASCTPFEFTNSIALGALAGRDYRPRIIGAGA